MSLRLHALPILCLLLLLPTSANAIIALEIQGDDQGHIEGEMTFIDERDMIEIMSFASSVYMQYDPATGRPSGRVSHAPIIITKNFDRASVPMTQALLTAENLSDVRIRFWQSSQTPIHYYTISLRNAALVSVDQAGSEIDRPYETWGLVFEQITWIDELTNTEVTDTWRDVAAAVLPPGPSPQLSLLPPLPNPTHAETVIRFDLPLASRATLDVFDVRGRRVTQLFNQTTLRPRTVVHWNGRDFAGEQVANGLYLVKLRWPEGEVTQRVTLIR